MPVPKRKHSKSRQGKRRAAKFIRPSAMVRCPSCNASVRPHAVCLACGVYKGKNLLHIEKGKRGKEKRSITRPQHVRPEDEAKPMLPEIDTHQTTIHERRPGE